MDGRNKLPERVNPGVDGGESLPSCS